VHVRYKTDYDYIVFSNTCSMFTNNDISNPALKKTANPRIINIVSNCEENNDLAESLTLANDWTRIFLFAASRLCLCVRTRSHHTGTTALYLLRSNVVLFYASYTG
jgi:hypothetical protein